MTIGNAKWIFVDKNLLTDKSAIEERLKATAKQAADEIIKPVKPAKAKPS